MKKLTTCVTLVVFLSILTFAAGCTTGDTVTGSGELVIREMEYSDFTKIQINEFSRKSSVFEVDIKEAASFTVNITIDNNLIDYLDIEQKGDTLHIGLEQDNEYRDSTMEVIITMPELTGLDLRGGSYTDIMGFKSTKSLDIDLSGGSHLQGDIESGDASFDLSGGSHVTLDGSGQDVTIDASDGSYIDLASFPVVDTRVDASDGSHVTVNSSGILDVDASGGSHVFYLGNPTLGDIHTSGGSEIIPK